MTLRALYITFAPETRIHVRYTTANAKDGPGSANPGTVRRRKEVTDLARVGLREALEALEGDVVSIGEAGFTQREDVLQLASPETVKLVKGRT